MKKHKVLYDLSLGLDGMGFSGIPQDTRLLFYGLTQSSLIDPVGMIRPYGESYYHRGTLDRIDRQSVFLGPFLNGSANNRSLIGRAFGRINHRLGRAWQAYGRGFNIGSALPVADPVLGDLIWRRAFASTLPPAARESMVKMPYVVSKLGSDRIAAATLGLLPTPRLDTAGYEFFLSQDSKPLRLHPKTQLIVRYHDGLPVTASDTMASDFFPRYHVASIKRVEKQGFYVCNSTSSLEELASISPIAAERAKVIPYFIPKMKRAPTTRHSLEAIAGTRMSTSTLKSDRHQKMLAKWMGAGDDLPPYILSLATIEPRKNYQRLIEAWQLMRLRSDRDVRLMIVGKPGWQYEATLKAMRPYVEKGELLHLEGVKQDELPYLYSGAAVFAFPSFAEGFGLPPTEAMQCGCPVVLSDIPAHRYMASDAAIWHDPYDVDGLADALEMAMHEDQRQTLIQRGIENAKRFSIENVLPMWEDLFDGIKARSGRNL